MTQSKENELTLEENRWQQKYKLKHTEIKERINFYSIDI